MSNLPRAKILLEHLDWNIKHLQEILKNPKTVYYRDASIQRFGFTVGLSTKCFKALLELDERAYPDPKALFQAADEMNWFKGVGAWESVVLDYDQIKDGFKNDAGEAVYANLSDHLTFFQRLYESLSNIPHKEDSFQTE